MASPAGPFPSEPDDDDRPGLSIRPLSHHDLDAILAEAGADQDSLLAGTRADRPVVAVRVRATVGRPGASPPHDQRPPDEARPSRASQCPGHPSVLICMTNAGLVVPRIPSVRTRVRTR
jgi:hypothetical protein